MRQKVEIIGFLITLALINYVGFLSDTTDAIGNSIGLTHFALLSITMSFWISVCIIMEFYQNYKPNTLEIILSLLLTVNYIQLYLHSEISFLSNPPIFIDVLIISIIGTIIWFAQIFIGVVIVISTVGTDQIDKRMRSQIDDPYGDKHASDILDDE